MHTLFDKPRSALVVALASCLLAPPAGASTDGVGGTGLDLLVRIIRADPGLKRHVRAADIDTAAGAASAMNAIIVEAIVATGTANDGALSTADARELNDYIHGRYADRWRALHGDDEHGGETGFHLVQDDGARTRLFGRNAVDQVADGIYHLGFDSNRRNRLLNEDGNANKSFARVAEWLSALLAGELDSGVLKNPEVVEVTGGSGTGLDQIIDMIYADPGLQKRVSTGDLRAAAAAADAMNRLIVEAIRNTGVAQDGSISVEDARALNAYLVTYHGDEWPKLHGDDEDGEESGFHLIQNDGARARLYGRNAVNRVFDGLYHLGFATDCPRRLLNEDGDPNARFRKVALWLNLLLAGDLADGSLN